MKNFTYRRFEIEMNEKGDTWLDDHFFGNHKDDADVKNSVDMCIEGGYLPYRAKEECSCIGGVFHENCNICNGSGEGSYDGSKCSVCKGSGMIQRICNDCSPNWGEYE